MTSERIDNSARYILVRGLEEENEEERRVGKRRGKRAAEDGEDRQSQGGSSVRNRRPVNSISVDR